MIHLIKSHSPIAHGPGPPHLPHIPGGGAELLAPADETVANTLSARAVCFEPHLGHTASSALAAFFTSFSNLLSHFRQLYS